MPNILIEKKLSIMKKKNSNGDNAPWYFNWFTKNLYLAIALILVLIVCLSYLLGAITRHGDEFAVPSFTGLSVEDAGNTAKIHELRIEVTDSVHNSKLRPGTVIKQNPVEGSKVKKNRRILLTINCISPKMVPMPLLEGYSLRQAKTELEAAQLKIGKLVYVEDIATNNVIKQYYKGKRISAGTLIPAESVVDLEVGRSSIDDLTYVPDLLGYNYQEIIDIISDKSLNLESRKHLSFA